MKRLFISIIVISAVAGLSFDACAESESEVILLRHFSGSADSGLHRDATIAVLLSGNNPLLTRVAEDAISIELSNSGYVTIGRELLEKAVSRELSKRESEPEDPSINALDIGAAVQADVILSGTVIVESSSQGSLAVKLASFRILDVATGSTLFGFLLEANKGTSFSAVATSLVQNIGR